MMKIGPELLILMGVSLNLVEYFTRKDTAGGAVFGTEGILTPINAQIPQLPLGPLPANIATWLAIIGLMWFVVRRFT